MRCTWCGKEFEKQTSVRQRQVIWVRKMIRLQNRRLKVHGPVSTACNDKLSEFVIANLKG